MIDKIEADEIEFMQCFNNSICMAESLFSNYDNLSVMEDEVLGHIRIGQFPLLSYESMLDTNSSISEKDMLEIINSSDAMSASVTTSRADFILPSCLFP